MTNTAAPFSTNVPGLDPVLGGGITPGSLALIIGPPGAGKTVLASQIVFGAARQGVRALIFTAYSEGHVKYLNHLRAFEFFDESLIGDTVTLLSMQTLLTPGTENPSALLLRVIREARAQIVLLDGFQGLEASLPNPGVLRTFLAALAAQMSFVPTTMLLTIAGDARDSQFDPELTTADVVVGMRYSLVNRRHVRRLEVVKQRGRVHLSGTHSYFIQSSGLRVMPRIEVYPVPGEPHRLDGRAAFGLSELDKILYGGLTVGSSTVLAGAPSTGKTTLALHWALADARPDARTLLVSLSEYPDQLIKKASSFGLPLDQAIERGTVQMLWLSPVDLDPDYFANALLETMSRPGVTRLVIDDMSSLLRELDDRAYTYCQSLRQLLYGLGVTSLFMLEIDAFAGFKVNLANNPVGVLAENLIVVQQVEDAGEIRRVLAVLRMRFSDYDRTLRELALSDRNVQVLAPEESRIDGEL
ncbi:MAG TPA: ATPase domain-containing protein [Roseiflexaceae bacterium]|nr:ATPase domain-containing protein [Roseiflexaceae bacterium]